MTASMVPCNQSDTHRECQPYNEDGQESELKKRTAMLQKSMQTVDADRRNKFTQKFNAARYAEKSREVGGCS